jgi:hypothetical protein
MADGEKPGLVVREEDSRPRGRGFESCYPAVYWMDVSDLLAITLEKN